MAGYGKSRVLVNVRASTRVLARDVVHPFRRKCEGRCVRTTCLSQSEMAGQQTPSKYVGVGVCSLPVGTIDSVAGGCLPLSTSSSSLRRTSSSGQEERRVRCRSHPSLGLHQYCATRSLPDVLYPRLDDRQCACKTCLDPAPCKGVRGAFISPGALSIRGRRGLHLRASLAEHLYE